MTLALHLVSSAFDDFEHRVGNLRWVDASVDLSVDVDQVVYWELVGRLADLDAPVGGAPFSLRLAAEMQCRTHTMRPMSFERRVSAKVNPRVPVENELYRAVADAVGWVIFDRVAPLYAYNQQLFPRFVAAVYRRRS